MKENQIKPRIVETHKFTDGYAITLLEASDLHLDPVPYLMVVNDPDECHGASVSSYAYASKMEAREHIDILVSAHLEVRRAQMQPWESLSIDDQSSVMQCQDSHE